MRLVLLANLVGASTPFLFALVDAPGVWPSGIAMVVAGAILGAFSAVRGERQRLVAVARRPAIWAIAAIVGLQTCAIASSVSFTTVVVSSFITQLAPIVTLALGPLFAERPSGRDGIAVLLAVASALFLARGHAGGSHASHLIGVSLALAGTLGSGLTLHLQRRLAVDALPAIPAQALTLLLGGLLVLPLAAPPDVTPRRIGLVLAIAAVFASANVLLFVALRRVSASRAVVARPFGPLLALIVGPLAFHQQLEPLIVAGCALSLAATAVAVGRVRSTGTSAAGENTRCA